MGLVALTMSFSGFAVLGVASATGAAAQTTTTTASMPVPIQGNARQKFVMFVDTVEGAGGTPAAAASCELTNLFVQGQVIVFRMYGIDVQTNRPLTSYNVSSASLSIPGESKIAMNYGPKDPYWTAAFKTAGYTLGTVNFTVTMTSKRIPKTKTHAAIPSETDTFTTANSLYKASPLTITAA
jgi:hypothetical protein